MRNHHVRGAFLSSVFIAFILLQTGEIALGAPPPGTDAQKESVVTAGSPNFVPNAVALQMPSLVLNALDQNSPKKAGFRFRYPSMGSDASYKTFSDDSPGGFSGSDYSFSLSGDADVYDGWLAGVVYGHVDRQARDGNGTSSQTEDHYCTLYLAKQYFGFWNVGGYFLYDSSESRLTGATTLNLDSSTDGYTIYTGVSKAWGKFSASVTTSYVWNNQEVPTDYFQSLTFVWSNGVGYRITERWSAGFNGSFSITALPDGYVNSPIRDSQSWTFGPRLSYKATDRLSLSLSYGITDGPSQFNAQTIRLGVGYQF